MGFIGRGDDDGRPLRQYRGKPQPLGTLIAWTCPSCGSKVEGRAYEQGCPHCGVGTPEANAQPIREPQPAAPADRVQPPASPREAGPSRPKAERPVVVPEAAALVVTRIIQYVCRPGQEAAMEQTLQRALVGRVGFAWGEITAAIVDDVSKRQEDILSLARRQPGVWLGGPETTQWGKSVPQIVREALRQEPQILRYGEPPGREEAHPGRPFVGAEDMERIVPDTGPSFSRLDQAMAQAIVQACGVQVAYTLTLALQSLAAGSDDTDPLTLSGAECLSLANAILQLIPPSYMEPVPPPPPPAPGQQEDDPARAAAKARVEAIRAASTPTPE